MHLLHHFLGKHGRAGGKIIYSLCHFRLLKRTIFHFNVSIILFFAKKIKGFGIFWAIRKKEGKKTPSVARGCKKCLVFKINHNLSYAFLIVIVVFPPEVATIVSFFVIVLSPCDAVVVVVLPEFVMLI